MANRLYELFFINFHIININIIMYVCYNIIMPMFRTCLDILCRFRSCSIHGFGFRTAILIG